MQHDCLIHPTIADSVDLYVYPVLGTGPRSKPPKSPAPEPRWSSYTLPLRVFYGPQRLYVSGLQPLVSSLRSLTEYSYDIRISPNCGRNRTELYTEWNKAYLRCLRSKWYLGTFITDIDNSCRWNRCLFWSQKSIIPTTSFPAQ